MAGYVRWLSKEKRWGPFLDYDIFQALSTASSGVGAGRSHQMHV